MGSTLVILLFGVFATATVLVVAVLGALFLIATPLTGSRPAKWSQADSGDHRDRRSMR